MINILFNMKKKIIIISLLAAFLLNSGFGCKGTDQTTEAAMKNITLTYWRVFDESDAFQDIINKYQALHPYVKIEYRKLRYEEYENELLNALAEDRGPDVFSIHNTWVKKYQSKLSPLPTSTSMVYPVTEGTLKKETVYKLKATKSLTAKDIQDKFVDAVAHDAILDGQIYGLPLSVDTLAIFYNRDLLNNAGISNLPKYWNKDFLSAVKKLTKQSSEAGIIQAGAGLGGSSNIQRYSDILSVLMMQNGAVMQSGDRVTFSQIPDTLKNNNYNPGIEALRFYTDFANPLKESYSWNSTLPNSLDLFISGRLALFFGYSYNIEDIRTKAPKLNYSISSLPQIEGSSNIINFANYWLEVVSKKSKNQDAAWDFIQYITKEEQAKSYLEKTGHPTALKSLVDSEKEDPEIGVFANQLLTAKSWYIGRDSQSAEAAFKEMIDNALNSALKIEDIINNAAIKVQQTIY